MTTDTGRAYVAAKMRACRSLTDLQRVWYQLAVRYQREPQLFRLKEQLKKRLEAKNAQGKG